MKVSLIKIINSDYPAILFLLIPLIMIILSIDAKYFNFFHQFISRKELTEIDSSIFFVMTIVSIFIFIPLFILRIKHIREHFKTGIEVIGKIIYLSLWRDRGRVEYEYTINGLKYRSGNAIHRSKFVNSLTEGQKVAIIVSKYNPKKGFLKGMYISE